MKGLFERYIPLLRHWIWLAPLVLGVIFVAAGGYMILQGQDAKNTVKDQIVAEQITTSKDASIPNVLVTNADTAESQANAIQQHTLTTSDGKTYSQLDRYLTADGTGTTNDAKLAMIGANGKPVANPVRDTAFQGAALRTSLNLAVMGFKLSDLVIGMGVFMLAIGGTFVLVLSPAVYYTAEMANHHNEIAKKEEKARGQALPASS